MDLGKADKATTGHLVSSTTFCSLVHKQVGQGITTVCKIQQMSYICMYVSTQQLLALTYAVHAWWAY